MGALSSLRVDWEGFAKFVIWVFDHLDGGDVVGWDL